MRGKRESEGEPACCPGIFLLSFCLGNEPVKVAVFSTKRYDRESLKKANGAGHELRFFEPHLDAETVKLAAGFDAVCVFVNDRLDAAVVASLAQQNVRLIALRCAGFNN